MVMTLHKLTAGDGYLYLVRQVAATDSTQRGRSTLADYYSAHGEAPGRWVGRGLTALSDTGGTDVSTEVRETTWAVAPGSVVSEEQMRALYGEGLHPKAEHIMNHVAGQGIRAQHAAGQLGRRFQVRGSEPEFTRRLAVAYREYNAAIDAQWNATIDADVRARIRTRIARELFDEQYDRSPADERELTGFIARNTRAATTAVAGYDLTFSPVKSVSTLWAIAPLHVAEQIESAHDAAVNDVLEWLQDTAAFTRVGANGIAQVDTEGLIAAVFTHRDSRAGDPDLHTHVAISNKVSHVDESGVRRWLALDGQPLHRITVAASEMYNTRLEAHLIAALGVNFIDTSRGRCKRPVREIAGIPAELMTKWSSRRAAISIRSATLAAQFQANHRREPTHVEIIALAQQATLETREAKHEPRSLAEQRAAWRTQATQVLGRDGLQRMLADILTGPGPARSTPTADERWVKARAGEIIATVSHTRSTWQRHHIHAEALRVVRAHGMAHDVALAERLTDTALGDALSVTHARVTDAEMGEPIALRRRDGASVYRRHGVQLYTSRATLAAERRILLAVSRLDGRCATDADVALALADSSARDRTLNPGQVALVTEMATSRRRVSLALAPAGTGKTTAMAALSCAWRNSGGHVLGLAPTADAAILLGEDLGAPTDTLDKYVWSTDPSTTTARPDWFARIGPDTLIVVDEAGKASTAGLDALITGALIKGASIRLVGDDGQLSSISAGGILRDIAEATDALTLSEVVRFRDPAEAAAGLALHAADPAGIGFYLDHHRIHVGTDETAADMAYQAWRTDLTTGMDSILLAPTHDVINALNARARIDRLATHPDTPDAPTVVLADGLEASIGDTIRTRRNARGIRFGRNDFVRNGYRYTITDILADGSVEARHLRNGRTVTLPGDYVTDHVSLGYAATIDSAQGLTAGNRDAQGSCHIVGSDTMTRQHLYVALTRATDANHLYLSTAEADPHRLLSPKATHPDTAVDVLTRALARDGAQVSATTEARRAAAPSGRLQAAADMFYDALGAGAEHHLGTRARDRLDAIADTVLPTLSTREAWPVLRRNLAVNALAGADPRQLLVDALAHGSVADAADPAAVLDHRIDPTGSHSCGVGVLRWLPAIPAALQEDPHWGDYLRRREQLVEHLADEIRAQARDWTNGTAPAWARPLVTVNTALTAEVAVFRAAVGVDDGDTRLTGALQYPARTAAIQTLLRRHAAAGIGRHSADTTRWNDLLDTFSPRLRADSYWPQLAANLARAARTTPDLRQIITNSISHAPLPDELPAAALWWRIVGAISPAASVATTRSRLRPAWITDLDSVFGTVLAETIIADPHWPGLIAAISAADPDRWTPRDLLQLADEHLADTKDSVPAGDFARLITYAVDAFTHHLRTQHGADLDDIPIPDDAPPDPADDEHLPPDSANLTTYGEIVGDEFVDDHPGIVQNNDLPAFDCGVGPFEGLPFDALTTTAPPRALRISMEGVATLQQQYRAVCDDLNSLEADLHQGAGPAMRAANDEILRLRRQIDADRPYGDVIATIMEQWFDADAAQAELRVMIEHARVRLHTLLRTDGADELEIASARADLDFQTNQLPDAEYEKKFEQALAQAREARAAAAGGYIITEADLAKTRGAAEAADRTARDLLRQRRDALRHDLDRAERDIVAAFATAHTAADDTLDALLAPARLEVDLLKSAGRVDIEHARLTIPDTTLITHDPTTAALLKAVAGQPYLLSYTRTDTTDPDTLAALHTLRIAANAENRKVLWLSTTDKYATAVRAAGLADATTTIDDPDIDEHLWSLQPHPLVLIDNPADVDPAQLATLIDYITSINARAILLDNCHHGPSTSVLRLLATTTPWTTELTRTVTRDRHGAPTPAITLASRLERDRLSQPWPQLLAQYDTATRAIRSAHRLQLTLSWQHRVRGLDTPDHSLGIDD